MNHKELAKNLKNGKIFIVPGNEAYELICDISSKTALKKLVSGGIEGMPSIIAYDKAWLDKNLYINKKYVEKLPGPFTFLFKAKKNNELAKYGLKENIIAVRLTNNDLARTISKNKILLFSYIIKRKGKLVIASDAIPSNIKKLADFMIDAGTLESKPHIVLDLTGKIAKIIK